MTRTFLLILSSYLLMLFISCKEKSKESLIVGQWIVDSVKKYDDGEANMIRISEDDNLFLGSISNPSMANFTNQHEAFFYKKNDTKKTFSTYEIKNDTLECKSVGTYKIIRLTEKILILEIERKMIYFDNKEEHPKQILTYYLTKAKTENDRKSVDPLKHDNTDSLFKRESTIDSLKEMFGLSIYRLDSITATNMNLQGDKSPLQKQIDTNCAEIRKILRNNNANLTDLDKCRSMLHNFKLQLAKLEATY